MASTKRGFTEGTWNGVVLYQCDFCRYAAPGKQGLLRIKRHVAGHMQAGERPKDDPSPAQAARQGAEPEPAPEREAVVDFASDQAAELAIQHGEAVIRELMRREPSGRTGYTVADVREAAAALTSRESTED